MSNPSWVNLAIAPKGSECENPWSVRVAAGTVAAALRLGFVLCCGAAG